MVTFCCTSHQFFEFLCEFEFRIDVSHENRCLWSFPLPPRTVDTPFNCVRKPLSQLSPWSEVGMGKNLRDWSGFFESLFKLGVFREKACCFNYVKIMLADENC